MDLDQCIKTFIIQNKHCSSQPYRPLDPKLLYNEDSQDSLGAIIAQTTSAEYQAAFVHYYLRSKTPPPKSVDLDDFCLYAIYLILQSDRSNWDVYERALHYFSKYSVEIENPNNEMLYYFLNLLGTAAMLYEDYQFSNDIMVLSHLIDNPNYTSTYTVLEIDQIINRFSQQSTKIGPLIWISWVLPTDNHKLNHLISSSTLACP